MIGRPICTPIPDHVHSGMEHLRDEVRGLRQELYDLRREVEVDQFRRELRRQRLVLYGASVVYLSILVAYLAYVPPLG